LKEYLLGGQIINTGKYLAITGGLGVFFIFCFFFIYPNSDFDHELINQVQSGTPTDKLTLQIEQESEKEKNLVLKHLEAHINDMNYWSKIDNGSKEDFEYYIDTYKMQIDAINNCEKLRKEFINHEISEDYYLEEISLLKARLET
jgi:hypothetical protein